MQISWILSTLWFVLLIAPAVLVVAVLPGGRRCPRCGDDTVRVQSPLLEFVRRWLTRRWCIGCGWEGVARCGYRTRPRRSRKPAPGWLEEAAADDDA
jgi:hypothetical protein